MLGHAHGRRRIARGGAALLWAAAALLEGAPALAQQRRRAEPEANPTFQQELKGNESGGPLAEPGAVSARETAIESTAPALPAIEEPIQPRSVQSIQIGAAAPARPAPAAAVEPLDTRVTVRVKGAPLATFLDTISAQARVNFIITDGVEQQKVTAFLQNVTVREALQVLLEIKGLTYQRIGKSNTYVVNKRSREALNLVTRIYPLSFVTLIDLTPKDSPGSQASQTQAAQPGQGGGGGAQGPGQQKPCAGKNAAISVAKVVCTVLSKHGDVELEPRTNSLVVTDIPESFPQVEQIIAELDRKAPQVMIEAQIVEIDSNRSRELGFEWGGTNGELATFTGGSRDTSFPLNLPKNLADTHFFDPLKQPGGLANAGTTSSSGESSSGAIVRPEGGIV